MGDSFVANAFLTEDTPGSLFQFAHNALDYSTLLHL